MGRKIYKSVENRQHPRISFKPGERPVLRINNNSYEVEDISEGGIKFLTGEGAKLENDISGTLEFPDGAIVEIEGSVIWHREDVVGLSFYNLLASSVVNREQQEAFLKTEIAIPTLSGMAEENVSGYSNQDLIKLGIASKYLKEWMTYGYIEPTLEQEGQSSKKLFSLFDLYLVKLFSFLVGRGFSEGESSLRIKILALAEKKSSKYFYEKSYIGFSRKINFNIIPDDMKQKMMQWLFHDINLDSSEEKKMKKILKCFVPVLIEEKDDTLILPASLYNNCNDILIVNFKKIRDEVDSAVK